MPKFDIAPEAMQKLIASQLEREINEIADRHIAICMQNIESDVRAKLGRIALNMLEHYSIERFGSNLRIEVRNEYSPLR